MQKREKSKVFAKEKAVYFSRIISIPPYSFIAEREMKGKFGWFDSSSKNYNLQEYYSGYTFNNQHDLDTYIEIINS